MIDENGQQWVEIERLWEAQERPRVIMREIVGWFEFIMNSTVLVYSLLIIINYFK